MILILCGLIWWDWRFFFQMRGAMLGALVADALTLGTHYEYDAVKIKQFYGSIDTYYAPGQKTGGQTHGVGWGARNFHNGNGNGPPKKAGEQVRAKSVSIFIMWTSYASGPVTEHHFLLWFTILIIFNRYAICCDQLWLSDVFYCWKRNSWYCLCPQTDYGDYNLLMLKHLANTADNPRRIQLNELLPFWSEELKTWRSWICTQTRQTLQQVCDSPYTLMQSVDLEHQLDFRKELNMRMPIEHLGGHCWSMSIVSVSIFQLLCACSTETVNVQACVREFHDHLKC